jgi:hypothetical protein
VDPVPDPLRHRKSGSAGNRTRTFGSVGRNSDHWTTEAAIYAVTALKNVRVADLGENTNAYRILGRKSEVKDLGRRLENNIKTDFKKQGRMVFAGLI